MSDTETPTVEASVTRLSWFDRTQLLLVNALLLFFFVLTIYFMVAGGPQIQDVMDRLDDIERVIIGIQRVIVVPSSG